MPKRIWTTWTVGVLATGLLVTSCGGATSQAPTTLYMAVSSIGSILDNNGTAPAGGNAASASMMINYISSLLKWKPLAPDAQNLGGLEGFVPDLATSYTVTPEGVVFKLRTDAKSPSGNVMSSDDVVYSYQRAVARSGVVRFLLNLGGLDAKNPATAIDAQTVRLNGTKLTPIWLIDAWFYGVSIIDSKLVKSHATASDEWAGDWMQTHIPTFGAYQVDSFSPGTRITLTVNPNFYGPKPAYSKVVLTPLGGQSAAALLGSNTVQVAEQVPLADFAQILKGGSKYHALAAPSAGQEQLDINKALKPFADVNVRRAMSMAFDRASLVNGPYFGVASPAVASVPASILPASASNYSGQYYKYDLAAAKQLMAQSGFPKGFSFTLSVCQCVLSSGVDAQAMATDIQATLKPLNITVNINVESNAALFQGNLGQKKYDAFYWTQTPLLPDVAYSFAINYVTNACCANLSNLSDPVIDGIAPQANQTAVGPQRDALALQEVQRFDDQMWEISLVDLKVPFATVGSVCGLAPSQPLVLNASSLKPCA